MEAFQNIDALPHSSESSISIADWRQSCYDAMNDDFNSPILIAQLFEGAKFVNAIKEGNETITEADKHVLRSTMSDFIYEVLGLVDHASGEVNNSDKLSGAVDLLIALRNQARANKDFATSDYIRDELQNVGIQLKDGKDGTSFSVN